MLERLKRWIGTENVPGTVERLSVSMPVVELDPGRLAARLDAAAALLASGAADAATTEASAALDLDPACARAHLLLAQACRALDRLDDAADSLQLAIHCAPTLVEAYVELAAMLKRAGRLDEALACYQEGLAQVPGAAILHSNLGLLLFDTERPTEALAACTAAIELDAQLAQAWHNRGHIQLQIGAPGPALEDFDRALALQPTWLATQCCSGHALRDLGRFEEARERYRAILEHAPHFADAQMNLAFTDLLLGAFAAGWPRYEWRFGTPGQPLRGFPYPLWRGEPLAGKGLLVLAEQAIGDEIMFASCIPDVLAQARHCVIECNTRLARLFARSFPRAHVHGAEKTASQEWLAHAPRCDYQVAIGSLPAYLRTTREAFAGRAPHLVADPERVDYWRREFAADHRPVVGISWRGGTLRSRQVARSLQAEQFAPILRTRACRFVSLQFRARADELAILRERSAVDLPDLGPVGEDIDDLAALVSALDLVISVGCTVVHVAGALGKDVWVMLAAVPEWRYGHRGAAMAWYPSARLFRQDALGCWTDVVEAVSRTLATRPNPASDAPPMADQSDAAA